MKQLLKTIAKPLLLLTLAVGGAFVLPELAHAAEPEEVEKTIASLLSIGVDFLNALLWPFLLIIGDLMDTDMILGPGMEEKLKGIWIPVRDLVNIGFVLVLLVVAFYNVLGIGGGEGDLALKTALPKIVLGLVLVNFTFIGGKVVLDLVNVATTAAFALPELAGEDGYDFSGVKNEFQQKVCYKSVDEATGIAISWTATTEAEEDKIPIYTRLFCTKADDGTYDELDGLLAAQYFTDLNSNNIGLVMAVNMGGLSSLSVLKAESIDSFSDLTVSILFALVMYLVFATSYLVLGIVLLVRIIVLWIALALSPLAVLIYVVPQIKEWAGGGGEFTQKVIKTLLAPVIIGLTMSLGYIMIDAWDGNLALDGGGFKANEVISKDFLIEGMDDLPQFIIALASILIVWTGVFAAANDTYAGFVTKSIEEFGGRVKDAALKAPQLLPSIPIGVKDANGKQQTTSFAALKGLVDNQLRSVDYMGEGQADELMKSMGIVPLGGTKDPRTNTKAIKDILGGAEDKTLKYEDAVHIAERLASIIQEKAPKGPVKDKLLEDVRALSSLYKSGKGDLEALQELVNDHTGEQLGFEDATSYKDVRDTLRGMKKDLAPNTPQGGSAPTGTPTPNTPPVPQSTPTPTPTPNADITRVQTAATDIAANPASAATARTHIATARAAIPTTDVANTNTLNALDSFVTAEEAAAASRAAPANTALRDEAATRVAAAQAAAGTASYTTNDTRLAALATEFPATP